MNHIKHRQIIIDYYVWEPFVKDICKEEDEVLHAMSEKKLLPHAGYVKVSFEGDK